MLSSDTRRKTHIVLDYEKPKLLIANVTFNPLDPANQRVTLYNNDAVTLSYTNLYLNASGSGKSHLIPALTLAPGEFITIDLGSTSFFNSVSLSGDYLFLNDSTSSISGKAPNGTVDFVSWTDILGNAPPSDGGTASANLEWSGVPVNLQGFDVTTDTGINRTWSGSPPVPAETDTNADWQAVNEGGFAVLILLAFMCVVTAGVRRRKNNSWI